jgi:hypothetical protein
VIEFFEAEGGFEALKELSERNQNLEIYTMS